MISPYTQEQIEAYLDHIRLPAKYRQRLLQANQPKDLELLTALHTCQLSTIPYENLSLHYSQDHKISLDPQKLYTKLMRNGRGGYCMENSIFYLHMLRGLGFNVYPTGVRIRPRVDGVPQGEYMGWVHIVLIVALPSEDTTTRYMIDVSFGGDGATKPLPLDHGRVVLNIGTQEMRLIHDYIPGQTIQSLSSQKLWIYQIRNNPTMEWNSCYSYSELEFLPQDYEVMNYFTSTSPLSFQTFTVLVVKFLRRESTGGEEGEEIYGKVMLVNGEVKRNDGGRTVVVKRCRTEVERIEALGEYFGITLTEEEKGGIRGMVTELHDGV